MTSELRGPRRSEGTEPELWGHEEHCQLSARTSFAGLETVPLSPRCLAYLGDTLWVAGSCPTFFNLGIYIGISWAGWGWGWPRAAVILWVTRAVCPFSSVTAEWSWQVLLPAQVVSASPQRSLLPVAGHTSSQETKAAFYGPPSLTEIPQVALHTWAGFLAARLPPFYSLASSHPTPMTPKSLETPRTPDPPTTASCFFNYSDLGIKPKALSLLGKCSTLSPTLLFP